eukprot:GHVP01060119.1.p1 GENE.GHVP01060119.1~~GHVP01060119.1.p1  ORF type:complete len:115 (+),score=16.26 GHVP01060119.1:189-533(+)
MKRNTKTEADLSMKAPKQSSPQKTPFSFFSRSQTSGGEMPSTDSPKLKHRKTRQGNIMLKIMEAFTSPTRCTPPPASFSSSFQTVIITLSLSTCPKQLILPSAASLIKIPMTPF